MTQICPNCRTANSDTSRFCMNCATPLSRSPDPSQGANDSRTGMLPPNSMLQNRYIITERLGKGGMGAVYASVDARIAGKQWAVKEMSDALITGPLEKEEAIAAFRREAEMLARLSHPNLPAVTDFFSEGGKQYLVMEMVQGHTLEALLAARSEPMPEEKVREWADQLCKVLTYLHERNPPIIFRDLKPSNIMLEDTGLIKLIDFGIARFFKAGRSQDTIAMGTPGYAAPEQYGRGQTDARSDIYSLGVTMHNLLTRFDPGLSPFNLPSPRSVNPAVSPAMDAVVSRATRTNPAERYASMVELQQALKAATPPDIARTYREPQAPAPLPVMGPAAGSPVAAPPASTRKAGVASWMWLAAGMAAIVLCLFLAAGAVAVATQTNWLDGLLGRATEVVAGVTDPTAPVAVPTTPAAEEPTTGGGPTSGESGNGSGEAEPSTDEPPTDEPPTDEPPTDEPPTDEPPTDEPPTDVPPLEPALITIGSSAGGRALEGFRFGEGDRAVVVVGGLHGGFAPGSVVFPDLLLQHFNDNPAELPPGFALFTFANVNPDSAAAPGELAGRLNANGVDLNRNFGCNWSSEADWRGTPVNPGSAPFSEPETRALRDFLVDLQPELVIFYEARATNGLVAAGRCGEDHPPSNRLRDVYAASAGYDVDTFELNGDSSDWLTTLDIPAISVLLKEYEGLSSQEWRDNLSGIRAVLLDLES